ncbi:alcohol dehydrogenase catalytic domain-containing protein [Candidatus Caldatribacterium sp. SIUC1]|uniref:alcohol dehydrogenase catalytic domain-containing protein n=1 Tax=Candidatus Caldatribacterium sp. SIUC1 TaxID=3418365 RepID=UPI003F693B20
MKAAVFSSPQGVRIVDVPVPRIGRGEVLLRVCAASLCGTDLRIARRGHGSIPQGVQRILGHEVVGEIVEVGEGVADLAEGMLVLVAPNYGCGKCRFCVAGAQHHCPSGKALGITEDGGFAEYMRVPEEAVRQGNIFPLPPEADPVMFSFVEALACVVHGFLPLSVSFRDTVLIYGAGPIGLMFLELARLSGAREVWMADISPSRLERAAARGARTIVVGEKKVKDVLRDVDVVIVAAPAPDAQREALEVAGVFGRINFFGGLPPGTPEVPLATNLIHYKELFVTGTTRSNNIHIRTALDLLVRQLDLSYLVSHTLPLEAIEEGLRLMEGKDALKVVLIP